MEECYFYYSCRLKSATLLKVTLLHGCFSCFINRTNGTKSHNAPHILNRNLRLASHQKLRKLIIKRPEYREPSKVCKDT